ncbi:hypothetical protein GE21DRAFT_1340034, partial [Neurospora crassa]
KACDTAGNGQSIELVELRSDYTSIRSSVYRPSSAQETDRRLCRVRLSDCHWHVRRALSRLVIFEKETGDCTFIRTLLASSLALLSTKVYPGTGNHGANGSGRCSLQSLDSAELPTRPVTATP